LFSGGRFLLIVGNRPPEKLFAGYDRFLEIDSELIAFDGQGRKSLSHLKISNWRRGVRENSKVIRPFYK
jgi:hypothetical protein